MDIHHKVELAHSAQQGSAASQLLRQNSGMLMAIRSSLDAIGSGLIRQETEKSIQISVPKDRHQTVDCVGARLNDLASMSESQNKTLLKKFEQLQSQIEELKALHGRASTAVSSTVIISDKLEQDEENGTHTNNHRITALTETVKKLCSLARKPRSTVFLQDAQCIISDIEKILSFISGLPQFTETNRLGKRKLDQTDGLEFCEALPKLQLQLDMNKMLGLLTSSEHVSINQQGLSYATRLGFGFRDIR